jgi:hypothetical protein
MSKQNNFLIIKTAEELEEYIPAWNNLVKNATDENVFFEPSILIPALAYLNNNQAFILLIFADEASKEQGLIGLFPLVYCKKYKGLPIPHLSIWQTQQCFLATPLVHKDYIETCLKYLFQWLEQTSQSGYFLFFREFLDDSLFIQHLECFLKTKKYIIDEVERYKRAFLQSNLTKDQYLKQGISSKRRKNWRNRANALAKLGKVNLSILDKYNTRENVKQWIQDFLQLEQSGWKGKEGTALACDEKEKNYFIEITKNAALQRKLLMYKLTLDNKTIAMQSNFIAHDGAFAFKVAYDESYSKYSPGMLLELENLDYILSNSNIKWMDSCAMPNSVVDNLWQERRIIRAFNISTQSWKSKLVVSLLSILRKCYRKIYMRE